jgi:capsular exopolysaccharide synthesis family protein
MTNRVDDQVEVEGAAPGESHGSFRILRIGLKHKGLVTLGVGIGLALGLLFLAKAPPTYQASAQVLVVKKRPNELPVPGSDARSPSAEDYLSTHQVLIRSPKIINKAIETAHLGRLKTLAGQENPTGTIAYSLGVTREMRNNNPTSILNITFRAGNPEDCQVVLDAVIDSYRSFLSSTYRNVAEETAKLITETCKNLKKELDDQETAYGKFRMEHPLIWKGRDGVNILQERLINIEAKRSAALIRQTEMDGAVAAFERALKEGHSRAELLAMVSESARRLASEGAGKVLLEDPITVLKLQEESLLDEYGPGHPKVQAVRRRLAALQERSKSAGLATPTDVRPLDPVQAHLQMLKRERDDARSTAAALGKLLEREQERAKKHVGVEKEDEAFRSRIARSRQLWESASKRLEEINVLKQFGGFEAEVISPARAGSKVYPLPVPILAIAGFLGLLAGFGLAYAAELSDQSFRTPDEIRQRLGLAVVGHVPYFDPEEVPAGAEDAALEPSLCAYYRPKSREAESYRGVRTAVYFNARKGGLKVIQVTSPDMGDGKSTLVANLAVSMAQSGKRVILVDADFRRPRIHKLFGVSGERGLATVISGDGEVADVIQETSVPGLSVLPCGPHPHNPAELLTQPRLKELLDYLRDQYDFVLLDTPPLLAVTDPCVVVPLADGALLTIRIGKNARPHAKRAKEILTTLGANVLGVVVNEADRHASSVYAYSGYRYGYGYSYRYYDRDKNSAYYTDSGEGPEGEAAGNGSAQVAEAERSQSGTRKARGGKRRRGNGRRGLFRRLLSWL